MTSFAAFLEVDMKEVADFVTGTLELVPQDEEFRQLNLDAELGWLIAWVFTDRERRILQQLAARADDCKSEWALGIEARSRALLSEGENADSRYREAIDRLGRTRVRVELRLAA
jgi:hypothetical protein